MADNEVDIILQNYFATIAEKDADALKLFEDNKRMRHLVEQALKAREELETQYRNSQLLVNSLQLDLREKQLLIEAQSRERAAWQDGVTELCALLNRPSELDHGVQDIVDEVKSMSEELQSYRQGMQYAQWCCGEWEGYVAEASKEEESRERRILEEAAIETLKYIGDSARDVGKLQLSAHSLVVQWETKSSNATAEWEAAEEKLSKALHEAKEKVSRHEHQASALQRRIDALDQQNAILKHEGLCDRQRNRQECVALTDLLFLLMERSSSAERLWKDAVHQLRICTLHCSEAEQEMSDLTKANEDLLLRQEQNHLRTLKLSKKVEHFTVQQSEQEELRRRCSMQQEDMQVLKVKYVSTADKERNLRYQLNALTEASAMEKQQAEEALRSLEMKNAVLEERIRATQEELKAEQKEMKILRQQVADRHAIEALLHTTQEQLRETERRSFNCQEALEKIKLDSTAELAAAKERHEEELAKLAEAHDAAVLSKDALAKSKIAEAESRGRDALAQSTLEKEALQREVQAWIKEVEKQKEAAALSRQRAEAERTAREVLEEQSRSENSVVRSLVERSFQDIQRESQLFESEERSQQLQERVQLLEEACRRSAAVIAQLREALHREQKTSRALRIQLSPPICRND